jgi:hypothetical protein
MIVHILKIIKNWTPIIKPRKVFNVSKIALGKYGNVLLYNAEKSISCSLQNRSVHARIAPVLSSINEHHEIPLWVIAHGSDGT